MSFNISLTFNCCCCRRVLKASTPATERISAWYGRPPLASGVTLTKTLRSGENWYGIWFSRKYHINEICRCCQERNPDQNGFQYSGASDNPAHPKRQLRHIDEYLDRAACKVPRSWCSSMVVYGDKISDEIHLRT